MRRKKLILITNATDLAILAKTIPFLTKSWIRHNTHMEIVDQKMGHKCPTTKMTTDYICPLEATCGY